MVKQLLFFSILFLGGISLGSLNSQSQSSPGISPAFKKEINTYLSFTVPTLSVSQLHSDFGLYQVLDAREKDEYETSHIPGALYVGYDHYKPANNEKLDKEKPVVVYCSIGYRSEKIGERLKREGFKKVYNLYGSLFAWANAGYELEDQNGQKTNSIHGYNRSWSKWLVNKDLVVKH